MNAILGFTDALLAGVDGPLNDEQKASLGWVQRGGRDLLGLINEILDLSKIEAGKLTLEAEPFDPRELVESVVAQHRSLAAQKGIRLGWHDAGAPAEVVLDRQRVRQILVNLVGNALKFTDAGRGAGRDGRRGRTDRSTSRSATPARASPPSSRKRSSRSSARPKGPGGHRPRPRDQPPARPSDGRRRHARERAGPREHLPPRRCRSTAAPRRPPPAGSSRSTPATASACCSASTTTRRSRRCSRRCSPATATGSSPRRSRRLRWTTPGACSRRRSCSTS